MEAIKAISEITDWLYLIIPAGAIFMISYQALRKASAMNDSVVHDANNKIKTTLIGAVIGISIPGLITLMKNFY